MAVQIAPASPRFENFSEKEGLYSSNVFVCPACQAGISFPLRVLSAASTARFNESPYRSKLRLEVAPAFMVAYGPFVTNDRARFVLDFHCPKCEAPYAIGFEWRALHIADSRYFPISFWSLAK